ncbi:unnamed protein product [Closterium sp. NIES-64]|nr:unnamed protein product [Closterium sp. NIES-64]CAI5974220.1 unnamed protein product [Closterium sp. NIES-65]
MAPRSAVLFALVAAGFLFTVALSRPSGFEAEEANGLPGSIFKAHLVDSVNKNPRATWKAGYNERVHRLSKPALKSLVGTYRHPPASALPRKELSPAAMNIELPKHFDARKHWSNCPSISFVRDQGHCGSCWAFGAVEALSDRFCVTFNETVQLSTNDLLSCCATCGDGCNGGWPYLAWEFFTKQGVVTEQCEPYFDQQGCKHPGCEPLMPTPVCKLTCEDGENWRSSKHYASEAYLVGRSVEAMMTELLLHGPFEVDFDVYEDFTYYKGGVYSHLVGDMVGGHAVKLVGWGTTDDGVDYWIIANSWNRSWGEDGFFRIRRGTNECGIEEDPVAGTPSRTPAPSPGGLLEGVATE